ncbi:MAG: FG-GAP-like repeat-containing protein [Saprospiraceae bacterium]|nr:FG-GAP-like repeat-containing protein [Saprospiraceae bacterium]
MKAKRIITSIAVLCLCIHFSYGQQFIQAQEEANLEHVFSQDDFNGGGVAFVDLDNDGDDDAYLVGGKTTDKIFINDGNGVFTEITASAGLEITEEYYTTGVIYGDIDNDGDEDLYVNTYYLIADKSQYSRNLLFLNNGDLTFTEIWGNGIQKDKSMTMGSTFIDYDLDGDLDIYNGNYVKEVIFTYDDDGAIDGFAHKCFTNLLYRNNGNGLFSDVSQSMGLFEAGCALAVTATDYDNDGDMDLLVGNDFGPFIEPNMVFRNDYNEGGKFTEVASVLGADQEMFSMGFAIGDYDNDLDLDYYISNLGKNVFLEKEGDEFVESAEAAGIENEFSGYNSSLSVSWGNLFADIDNDMDLDLFVANGYVAAPSFVDNSTLDPDRLFINNGDKTFTEADSTSGINNHLVSRGCAYSDIDMDGKIDILSIVFDKPGFGFTPSSCLFKNATTNTNNWVKIKLEGTESNRSAYGSKIFVYTGNDIQMSELNGGASFCSHNTSYMHFGIGQYESIDSVKIVWPGGKNSQIETEVLVNSVNYIKERISTKTAELDSDYFTISPSPSEGIITISGTNSSQFQKAIIFDQLGKRVVTSYSKQIDFSFSPSGTYFIKVYNQKGLASTKKITKL